MEPGDLYQEYAEMIYRFIFLKCNDRDLAEDIVQTTFLKAILQIHSFEGKSKVSTWLCQIARNEYLNYCRKHNRQQSYDAYLEKNREPSDGQSPVYRDGVLEGYRISEQLVYIPGTQDVRGNGISPEISNILATLCE